MLLHKKISQRKLRVLSSRKLQFGNLTERKHVSFNLFGDSKLFFKCKQLLNKREKLRIMKLFDVFLLDFILLRVHLKLDKSFIKDIHFIYRF